MFGGLSNKVDAFFQNTSTHLECLMGVVAPRTSAMGVGSALRPPKATCSENAATYSKSQSSIYHYLLSLCGQV